MNEVKTKKVIKKKLKISGLLFLLIVIIAITFSFYYVLNLPIKHIHITGNNNISDNDIIDVASIKYYPPIFKVNKKDMRESIMSLPLVKDVSVKKSIFGTLEINIEENKVLFLNKSTNELVLSNNKSIENNYTYTRVPTLINHVPDTIYEELITGLVTIDYDILTSISEIEYSKATNKDNEVIDEKRFILRMNDGNTVIMNTVNIKRLNSYNTIYSSLSDELGTIYLDSIAEENIYFKSYALEEQEKMEEEKKNEEELSNNNGRNP